MQLLREILTLPGALFQLARLGITTRFRLRGAYWSWRWTTAHGPGRTQPGEKRRAALEYARWVAAMRRL